MQENPTPTLRYTFRLIEDIYVVWIETYNQYLQLAEPAFFVFELYAKGCAHDNIVGECAGKYHLEEEKSRQFVDEIVAGLNSLTPSDPKLEIGNPANDYAFTPYSEMHYTIGDKTFLIRNESARYECFLHPLMEHLQTGDIGCKADFTYELFSYRQRVFLRYNGNIVGNWDENESQYVKGAAFIQLLNDIYKRNKSDWMTTLHASAVSNGQKAIAFSAASGSGKSTLAALLQAHGYDLMSDDFVAVDQLQHQAHPFPLAISVKDGALEALVKYYPELNEKESRILSANRSGRYLSNHPVALHPVPLNCLVFVEYNPGVAFDMVPMSKLTALQLIIDESWIAATLENVSQFLTWFSGISLYKLRYADNDKAISAVSKLFEA